MNRPLEIPHLSDLHLDKTSLRDQRVVLNAMVDPNVKTLIQPV
jgi:hypothetical protein